ncbi:MAG: M23 family metallopeptidase [Comamonadaceae bacterium]|nr:MAG: M23 family metallopeptidase [Comamonadaceae bacterium]
MMLARLQGSAAAVCGAVLALATACALAQAVDPADGNIIDLRSRNLLLPISSVGTAQLTDTYSQSRAAGNVHEALDIMSPRGTPVLAVDDGRVAKLFLSKPGGVTLYQFDQNTQYAYYYAHLDRYADGLKEGMLLSKGQVIGYVGSTGNASPDAPHLHFAIFRLGPERQWWKGTAVNPFTVWRESSKP